MCRDRTRYAEISDWNPTPFEDHTGSNAAESEEIIER